MSEFVSRDELRPTSLSEGWTAKTPGVPEPGHVQNVAHEGCRMNGAIAPLLERLSGGRWIFAWRCWTHSTGPNAWAVCRCGRNAGAAPAIPVADIS